MLNSRITLSTVCLSFLLGMAYVSPFVQHVRMELWYADLAARGIQRGKPINLNFDGWSRSEVTNVLGRPDVISRKVHKPITERWLYKKGKWFILYFSKNKCEGSLLLLQPLSSNEILELLFS